MKRRVKLNLRIDEALRRRLKDEAERSVRSINGEIIHRLLQSLKDVEPRERTPDRGARGGMQ